MSHIAKLELVINDLATLQAACKRLGLEFCEGQTSYRWYGVWASRSPVPQNFIPGKCHHAIRVPRASYEVGVIQQDAKTFTLHADMWPGGGLEPVIGKDAGLLKQAYAIERVYKEARQKRMRVHECITDTGIRLTLTA